jgi:uncharacterized protein
MNRINGILTGATALALIGGFTAPRVVDAARFAPADVTTITVTREDVDASNKKIESAYGALIVMWKSEFETRGERFTVPRLMRYREPIRTACGPVRPGNAAYCVAVNTIYFDDIFVAGQAKQAASKLGTDGDMAGIGVIAHEMGHAVAFQLGQISRIPYRNESRADCLAGAFAKHENKEGNLETGDLEEAEFGMQSAGQDVPEKTGDSLVDERHRARAALLSHGTPEQRKLSFRAGFEGGAKACLTEEKASR